MSRQALEATLNMVQDRMKDSSEAYRQLISDKKVHSIRVSQALLITQIKREMESRGGYAPNTLPKSIMDIITTEVPIMCQGMHQDLHPSNFNSNRKFSEIDATSFTGGPSDFRFTIGAKGDHTPNIFNAFRKVKQENQRVLIRKLNAQIKKLNKSRGDETQIRKIGRNFLDIGHQEGSAVSTQRAKEVEQALFQWSTDNKNPVVSKFIQELRDETFFKITKKAGEPIDTLQVELESKFINRQRGGGEEKRLSLELQKDFNKIIEAMDTFDWAGQEGSDSKVTRITKRVLNPIARMAKRNAKVTATFTPKTIVEGTTRARSKGRKNKVTAGASFKDTTPAKTPEFSRDNQQSMFSIMALINLKLPETVKKNMGYPRLENVSGRFAESARMVNVVSTPKGFPSFGYTYKRDPYEVFETGSRGNWATPERDPRALIDASIREIASHMALGRFFTRRV